MLGQGSQNSSHKNLCCGLTILENYNPIKEWEETNPTKCYPQNVKMFCFVSPYVFYFTFHFKPLDFFFESGQETDSWSKVRTGRVHIDVIDKAGFLVHRCDFKSVITISRRPDCALEFTKLFPFEWLAMHHILFVRLVGEEVIFPIQQWKTLFVYDHGKK